MSVILVAETLTSANGTPFRPPARTPCNLAITAITGTAVLKRAIDGTNYVAVSKDTAGAANSFTAVASFVIEELEEGVLWRLDVTGGDVTYRVSR